MTSSSHASPCLNAAMFATTPGLLAPCDANGPISSHSCRSGSLVRMTSAHLRPGRFQALEADVAVSVYPAAVAVDDGGELRHLFQREHAAERVARAAEDDQVPAGQEGVLDRVEVEG